jgi:hypothetical protein
VPISLEARALAKLPWGAQTKLSTLTIRNSTLRDALPQVLRPLALQHRVETDRVRVLPSPPLDRIEGRVTWKELELLAELASTPYAPEAFKKYEVQYRITSKVGDAPAVLAEQLARAGRGSIADTLETAAAALNWTWFPQDQRIVILSQQAAYARALARTMTGRYERRNLGDILFELGREADIHMHLQPGTFRQLPTETVQRYSLYLTNVSIRQALDYISADTGLAYSIEPDGVHVGPAENIEKLQQQTAAAGDAFVAKLSVPSTDGFSSFEFLLRESELTAEARQLRDRKKKEFLESLRSAASRQPAHPSTTQAGFPRSRE